MREPALKDNRQTRYIRVIFVIPFPRRKTSMERAGYVSKQNATPGKLNRRIVELEGTQRVSWRKFPLSNYRAIIINAVISRSVTASATEFISIIIKALNCFIRLKKENFLYSTTRFSCKNIYKNSIFPTAYCISLFPCAFSPGVE